MRSRNSLVYKYYFITSSSRYSKLVMCYGCHTLLTELFCLLLLVKNYGTSTNLVAIPYKIWDVVNGNLGNPSIMQVL